MDRFLNPLRIQEAKHQADDGQQSEERAEGSDPRLGSPPSPRIAGDEQAHDDEPAKDQPPRLRQLGELHHDH